MPPKGSQNNLGARTPRPSVMNSNELIIDNLNAEQFEGLLLHTLDECNRLSQHTEVTSREVVMAKMVNSCIRMLHSNGWVPRTVVRAMIHIEADTEAERTIKGMMFQAMREKRDEARAKKATKISRSERDNGRKVISGGKGLVNGTGVGNEAVVGTADPVADTSPVTIKSKAEGPAKADSKTSKAKDESE